MDYRGLAPMAGAILLASWVPAQADTVLVDELLDDGACDFAGCTVSEGQFVGDGWQVTSAASRLVFDLGAPVPCGRATVEFTGFDPIGNGHTGEYINFVGLYDGPHGNNWSAAGADEAQLQIQGTCDQCVGEADPWRDYRLKFKGAACSWDYDVCGAGNAYVPRNNQADIDWASTLDVHYVTSVQWSCSTTVYTLEGAAGAWSGSGEWGFHDDHADPTIHFRYLFVGRDHSAGSVRFIDDAVYVQVTVEELDDCDCPGAGDDDDASDDDDAGDDDSAGDDDTAGDDDSAANDDDDVEPDDDDIGEPAPPPLSHTGGCGCATAGGSGAAWGLALVLAARRRRRAQSPLG